MVELKYMQVVYFLSCVPWHLGQCEDRARKSHVKVYH
jgi:hypothetical protein